MHAYCGLGMRLGRIIVECCFTICMADAAAVMITPDFSILQHLVSRVSTV